MSEETQSAESYLELRQKQDAEWRALTPRQRFERGVDNQFENLRGFHKTREEAKEFYLKHVYLPQAYGVPDSLLMERFSVPIRHLAVLVEILLERVEKLEAERRAPEPDVKVSDGR